MKLLPLGGVAPTGDSETTLFSVVHNVKCLEALTEIKKGHNSSSDSASQAPASEATPTSGPSTSQTSASVVEPIEKNATLDRTRPLFPYTNMSDYTSLSDYLTSLPETMHLAQMVRTFGSPLMTDVMPSPVDRPSSGSNSTSLPHASGLSEPLQPKTYKSSTPECSCRAQASASGEGVDLLQPLVSDWPCLVATILGFYPTSDTPSDQTFCSVHSLDSFTSHLLLHCQVETVTVLVDTLVRKMNEALSLPKPSDLSLLTDNVEWMKIKSCSLSEGNVALLVGRRFVESAVRVLAMNHSRASNIVATSQQPRTSESKSHDCVYCHMTIMCSTDNRGSDWTEANTTQSRATGGQSSQRGTLSKDFSRTLW